MTMLSHYGALGGAPAVYVEDVFSTYLYTGNGSTQTITNNIDLSGKGGLVWIKARNTAGYNHALFDTVRGVNNRLKTDTTDAQNFSSAYNNTFNSDGFSIGAQYVDSGVTFASWTFRKQPKFFDVVTYTGNGATTRQINHNLGSVPGCIIVKCTNAAEFWAVYHRGTDASAPQDYRLKLNATDARAASSVWKNTAPTATNFTVDQGGEVNASGQTYVAYLFAHNAGGFGASGNDNVISCGSYVGNGSTEVNINLGFEPQWVMIKNVTDTGTDPIKNAWNIIDNMRGWTADGVANYVSANDSDAESQLGTITPKATGFTVSSPNTGNLGDTYIYIAIRRPMKTPTVGTDVFGINARTGTGANATVTGGSLPDDLAIIKNRGSAQIPLWASRLTGTGYLRSSATTAETAATTDILQANPWDVMNGVKVGTTNAITNASGNTFINYLFTRAPGFFDVVCYTGNDANRTMNHNLGVAPEFIIVKSRGASAEWITSVPGSGWANTEYLILNNTFAKNNYGSINVWNATAPTSTVFSLGTSTAVNWSSSTYIAYLFASCPGVSKVGSYTGNGSSQTINCGFTAGARFIMIKRTDAAGSWYVWDTARGIIAGNDPYFLMNSTAAEVTSDDSIDPANSGFIVNQLVATNINVSSATYIYLAIA